MLKLVRQFCSFFRRKPVNTDFVTLGIDEYTILRDGYIVSLWMHMLIYADAKTHIEERDGKKYIAFNMVSVNETLARKGLTPLLFPVDKELLKSILMDKPKVTDPNLQRFVEHFYVTWVHSDLHKINERIWNISKELKDIYGLFSKKM